MLSVPTADLSPRVALTDQDWIDLAATPGVRVRNGRGGAQVRAAADLAPALAARGLVPDAGPHGQTAAGPHGLIDLSRLHPLLRPWQVEAVIALVRANKRLVWHSAGLGKAAVILAAADLVTAHTGKAVLIVTRAVGRTAYARDTAFLTHRRRIGVVIGRGPRAGVNGRSLTAAQAYAIKRADRALDVQRRERSADVIAAGSVPDALAKGAWAVVVGWEILSDHEGDICANAARFSVVAFDEHHCGKAYNSRRTVAAHRIAARIPAVWGATATPVPDRTRDLWGQLFAVGGKAAWGTNLQFARAYCHAVPGQHGGYDTTGPHLRREGHPCARCDRTSAELHTRLPWWADMRNRRVIAQFLPKLTRALVHVPAEDVRDGVPAGRGGIEAAVAYAASAKLRATAERAAEALVAGDRVVVAGNRRAWVPHMLNAIQRALPNGLRRSGAIWLRSATGESATVDERAALANELRKLDLGPGRPWRAACLVVTADCVRTSIDLYADRVIVAALPWTPEAIEQFEGRFPRLAFGPDHRIQVDYMIAEGTIDGKIEETLLGKLDTLACVGAEVDGEVRSDLRATLPTQDEVLAKLHAWMAARAESIERSQFVREDVA